MQTIEMDGRDWRSELDFYEALASALGSFAGHGRNPDAFEETVIYYLDLNTVQPPYAVVIKNAHRTLRPFLLAFASWISEARQGRIDDPDWGTDVEVSVKVV